MSATAQGKACEKGSKPFKPAVFIPPITTRQPDGSLSIKAGKPIVLNSDDEIGTAEAARILGCSGDWICRLCDRGRFREGEDWRRLGARGVYRLKRASVIAFAGRMLKESEK